MLQLIVISDLSPSLSIRHYYGQVHMVVSLLAG